jgi:cation diffusion facilitator family transporter
MRKNERQELPTTGDKGQAEASGETKQTPEARDQGIVRTSIIGIIGNLFLVVFKGAIGLASNSIAILLDAVNNLTDALSSVITIVGARAAAKEPDREHPLGHGRIEYLIALLVAALVLYAGLSSLVESVKKMLHPETPQYSAVGLVIIAVAVLVKVLMGQYVKHRGKQLNSDALVASGSDASFDALLSASVLASALIFLRTGISLEAYVGTLISVMIVRSGYGMVCDTLDEILGKRPDTELVRKIRALIMEEQVVIGAYDLFITDYGPERRYGVVYLELPDTMTVEEVDALTRRIQKRVKEETGIRISTIGVYAHNTKDPAAAEMRHTVEHIALSHAWILQIHGFYAEPAKKYMRFDAVVDFTKSRADAVDALRCEIEAAYPGYRVDITPDADVSDLSS